MANAFTHAAAIEASLALAGARVADPTQLVYARLFAAHPAMQPLFCQDRNDAVKGEMLARAFDAILDFVGDRHYADHLLRSERMTHDAYGVPPEVFMTFFATIAATLRDILGPDWSDAMATAWDELTPSVAASLAGSEA